MSTREMWDYVNRKTLYYVEKLAEIKSEWDKGCVFIKAYENEKENDDHYTFLYLDGVSEQEKELAYDILTDVESEFWNELMKMDLRYFGEIENDIIGKTLNAAANKYITALNEGKECNFDICEEATRALLYLEDLGVITRKEYMDAGHILYEMDMEFCETFKWGNTK